jgi:hypothetical protein
VDNTFGNSWGGWFFNEVHGSYRVSCGKILEGAGGVFWSKIKFWHDL